MNFSVQTCKGIWRRIIFDDMRFYAQSLAALFFFLAAVGYVATRFYIEDAYGVLANIQKEAGFLSDLGFLEYFTLFFVNSAVNTLLVLILGFLFGIVPVIFVLLSGYTVGSMIALAAGGADATGLASVMLTQSAFEAIPLVIVSAYGVLLGERFATRLKTKKGRTTAQELRKALRYYAKTAIPLMAILGIVEAFVLAALF